MSDIFEAARGAKPKKSRSVFAAAKGEVDEAAFRSWYAERAKTLGLDANPDDPRHHYDYRAAYRAGAEPGADGHWPSQFKAPDHPNRYVDGVDTISGLPAPSTSAPEPAPLFEPRSIQDIAASTPLQEAGIGEVDAVSAHYAKKAQADRAESERKMALIDLTTAFLQEWHRQGRTLEEFRANYDITNPDHVNAMLDVVRLKATRDDAEFQQRKGELATRDITGAPFQGAFGTDMAAEGSSPELMARSRADASPARKVITRILGMGGALTVLSPAMRALKYFGVGRVPASALAFAVHGAGTTALAGGSAEDVGNAALGGAVQGAVAGAFPGMPGKTTSKAANMGIGASRAGGSNLAGYVAGQAVTGQDVDPAEAGIQLLLGGGLRAMDGSLPKEAGDNARSAQEARGLGMARVSAAESKAVLSRPASTADAWADRRAAAEAEMVRQRAEMAALKAKKKAAAEARKAKRQAAKPPTAPAAPETQTEMGVSGAQTEPVGPGATPEVASGSAILQPDAAGPVPRAVTPADLPDAKSASETVWYHGTAAEGLHAEGLDTIGNSEPGGLVGMGFYLTDDANVAEGYAGSRSRRGGKPTVYEARVAPRNVLNFETPLPPAVGAEIQRLADGFSETWDVNAGDAVRRALAEGRSGMDVYRAMTDELAGRVPSSEVIEPLQYLQGALREMGYDAITHIGGKRVGNGRLHRVLVMLDPNDSGNAGIPHRSVRSLSPRQANAEASAARPVPDGMPKPARGMANPARLTGDPEAGYAGDVPAEDSAPRVGMARGNPVKSIYEWGRDRLRAAFGESGARLADRGNPVGDRIAVEIDTARVHARELAADNEELAANVIHAARPKGVGGRAVNDLAQTPAKGFVTDDGAISTATAMRQYGMEPENAKMAALRDAEGAFSAGFWNSQAARGGTRTEGGVDVPMRPIEGPGKKLPNLSNDLDMEITETGPTHPLWETRIRADAQVQRLVGGSASEPQIRRYYEAKHEARSKDSNMVADEGHMASEFTRPFERAEFIRGEDGTLVPLLEVNPAKRAERVLKEGSVTFGMQMMVGRGKASRIDKMRKEFVEAEVRLRGSTPKQANADFTIAMRAGYGINPKGGSPLEPLDTRHGTYPRVIADTWDTTVQALRAMARSTAMATQAPSDLLTGNQAVPIGAANNLRAVAGTIWNALKSLAGKGETAAMKETRSLGLKTANPHNRTTSTHVPQDAARAQIRAFGDKTARPADEGQESAAALGIPMWLKGLSDTKEWNQFFKAQARMRLEIYGRSSRAEADAYLWGRMTPDEGVAYLKRMGHSIASSTTGSNLDRAQMSQFDQHPAVKKLFTFYRWFGQNLKITGRTLETYGREMGNLRTPGPDGAPVTKAQMAQRAAAANVELGRFMVYRALNGAMMKAMWAIFTGNEEQEWERFKKNPVGYLLKAMVETSVAGPAGALGMGILEGHVSLNNLLPVKVFRAGMDMAEVAFDAGILLGPVPALFGIGGQDPEGAALKAGATAEKLMPLIRAGTRSGFSEALKKHEASERRGMARGR